MTLSSVGRVRKSELPAILVCRSESWTIFRSYAQSDSRLMLSSRHFCPYTPRAIGSLSLACMMEVDGLILCEQQ